MPCRDYYDDHPDQYFHDVTEPALKKQVSFAESALCQTLAAFQSILIAVNRQSDNPDRLTTNPLDLINYEEAGITRTELEQWWENHKRLDEQHRKEEQNRIARKKALAKLTDAEKKLLGLE